MVETVLDIIGSGLIVLGSLLILVAAIALIRFPDLLSRQHAATKPQVLGLMLLVSGLAFVVRDVSLSVTVVLVVAFQLITSPISAHMLGRSGYRSGAVKKEDLLVDELGEDLETL